MQDYHQEPDEQTEFICVIKRNGKYETWAVQNWHSTQKLLQKLSENNHIKFIGMFRRD